MTHHLSKLPLAFIHCYQVMWILITPIVFISTAVFPQGDTKHLLTLPSFGTTEVMSQLILLYPLLIFSSLLIIKYLGLSF